MADRYADLKHFIRNTGNPARAGIYLSQFEATAKVEQKTNDERMKSYYDFCRRMMDAITNPADEANADMRAFAEKALAAKVQFDAYNEAGWKTAHEEGQEAFNPEHPIGWKKEHNPYDFGTLDYGWWHEGYSFKQSMWLEQHGSTNLGPEHSQLALEKHLELVREYAELEKFEFACVTTIFHKNRALMHNVIGVLEQIRFFPSDLMERLQQHREELLSIIDAEDADVDMGRDEAVTLFEETVNVIQSVASEWHERLPDNDRFPDTDLFSICNKLHELKESRK